MSLSGDNGILTNASKAKYVTELSNFNEELQIFKANKVIDDIGFESGSLISAENSLDYNTKPSGEEGNIYDVIPSLESSHFAGKLEVIKGELLLNSQDRAEINAAKSVGISVNPYEIIDGELVSSDGNLLLMDEATGTLRLPETVTSIGEGAFANLDGLKTIIIPGTVKEIKKNAFRNNVDLETVIMENGVEIIGEFAFLDCINLKNVIMSETLNQMKYQAFYNCDSLSEITIPTNVKKLSSFVFGSCNNIKTINLPEGLIEIENNAMQGCIGLEEIRLSRNVEIIGDNVFGNCISLKNIIIDSANPKYIYSNGLLMTKDGNEILFIAESILKSIDVFQIPDRIKDFNLDLAKYTNINKIIIPDTLENINIRTLPLSIKEIEIDMNNQFFEVRDECLYTKDMKTLVACFTQSENIDLISSLERIGDSAFRFAQNLRIIDLPDSVLIIDNYVFTSNKNLQSVKIGKNVKSIQPLFKYQNYSGQIIIDPDNQYYIFENGMLLSKDKTKLITVLEEINGKYSKIPSTVTEIGVYAIYGQTKMTEIELPPNLKILESCFGACTSLKEIQLPASIEKISSNCFSSAVQLERIVINKPQNTVDGSPWGAVKGNRIVEWRG